MRKIPLLKHHKTIAYAIVNNSDYKELIQYEWHRNYDGYATRRGPRPLQEMIFMHRVVNKTPEKYETDHINGNRLDNRRLNLRSVTHAENNWNTSKYRNNTSGYKGIYRHNVNGSWSARIKINGRRFSLGYYPNKKMAHFAYRLAERIFRVLPQRDLLKRMEQSLV